MNNHKKNNYSQLSTNTTDMITFAHPGSFFSRLENTEWRKTRTAKRYITTCKVFQGLSESVVVVICVLLSSVKWQRYFVINKMRDAGKDRGYLEKLECTEEDTVDQFVLSTQSLRQWLMTVTGHLHTSSLNISTQQQLTARNMQGTKPGD